MPGRFEPAHQIRLNGLPTWRCPQGTGELEGASYEDVNYEGYGPGGAAIYALDVTDPEPLPPGHALWKAPNCIITPHVGSTPEMTRPLLVERITANVKRYAHDHDLIGPVDPDLGY